MRIAIIVLVLFVTSCELIIDVDVPYDGDRAVVNAVQKIDSVWMVDLSSTRYILDNQYSYLPISNAQVTILKPDGTTEALVHKGNGMFRGTTRPQPGNIYKVSVTPHGFDAIEGEMRMPPLVKIIDLKWDSSRIEPNSTSQGAADVPFTLTFSDPAGEVNYYDVNVYIFYVYTYNRYPDGVQVTDTFASYRPTYIRDPGIALEDDQSEFSDKTFDGKTQTIPFITELTTYGNSPYKIEVWLTTSSEELYKYNKTQRLQAEVQGDPFAQPVQVYSNMSNGFGIFAGTADDKREYKVPQDN